MLVVEVQSLDTCIPIIVDFLDELIKRTTRAFAPGNNPAACPGGAGGINPGTGGTSPGGGGNGTTPPITLGQNTTPTRVQLPSRQLITPKTADTKAGSTPTATKKATLVYARLITVKKSRYLVVRVNSAAKTVKIQTRLRAAGHVVKTVTRTIVTNRPTRVSNLKIAKSVRSVSVRVLATS